MHKEVESQQAKAIVVAITSMHTGIALDDVCLRLVWLSCHHRQHITTVGIS